MPDFTNSHSTHIDADPAVVHALVDDFREWPRWSPWEGLDPDLERTFTGPETGVGSRYAWRGNSKAGAGTMEIRRSDPSLIEIALEFLKPYKASNTISFGLAPAAPAAPAASAASAAPAASAASGTDVTWTLSGERGVLMTLLGKVYFDRAVGKDFERGLAALKASAESA